MDIKRLVGRNVRKERTKLGWTQEKLAVRAGLNSQYLSRLELGQENVKIETIQKIAKSMKLKAAQFLEEELDKKDLDN